jgi:hypothetical protein
MIKANELRIGNLVYETSIMDEPTFDDSCIFQIGVINAVDGIVRDKDDNISQFEYLYPIPLTPEILEKCGFNIDGNGSWIHESSSLVNDFALEYDKSEKHNFIPTISMGEYSVGIDIKFVHQLQNKYFAWYGEELEIKD